MQVGTLVSPLIGAAIAGGAGGGIANVALTPVSGGANMLQSYWYGAGLILGERDMYTFHWEKIKKRLEAGEDYLTVLESVMNPAITAIAAYSLQVMDKTTELYKLAGINFLTDLIEGLLNPFFSGERSELLIFTASQIVAWSNQELRAAFENSLHLYSTETKVLITQAYKTRISDTEPPPPTETEPPPPTETEPTDLFLNQNAQGRVVKRPSGGTWDLQTRFGDKWNSLGFSFATMSQALTKAVATWPTDTYEVFTRKSGVDDIIYFILKTKL